MNLDGLDRQFSVLVRQRSDWTCAVCGRCYEGDPEELHCSHFYHRVHHAVRFDFENCDALCWECHQYMDLHPAEHDAWKLGQLGPERFEALRLRAQQVVKLDLKLVRANFKQFNSRRAA